MCVIFTRGTAASSKLRGVICIIQLTDTHTSPSPYVIVQDKNYSDNAISKYRKCGISLHSDYLLIHTCVFLL
jgi:hypothetical protein